MKKIIQINSDDVFNYLRNNERVYAICTEHDQFTDLYFTPVSEIHRYVNDDKFLFMYVIGGTE